MLRDMIVNEFKCSASLSSCSRCQQAQSLHEVMYVYRSGSEEIKVSS
jgi:hypothetical protein